MNDEKEGGRRELLDRRCDLSLYHQVRWSVLNARDSNGLRGVEIDDSSPFPLSLSLFDEGKRLSILNRDLDS